MYEVVGSTRATDEHSDLSFSRSDLWPATSEGHYAATVLLGDERVGPAVRLTAESADGCWMVVLMADRRNPSNNGGDSGLTVSLGPATRAVVSLMGDVMRGPVVVESHTEPGAVSAPPCRLDTEVFRLVVGGSGVIDGEDLRRGDMRVQRAGVPCDAVIAGPDGLRELVVIGDRRAKIVAEDRAWSDALNGAVTTLFDELAQRTPEIAAVS